MTSVAPAGASSYPAATVGPVLVVGAGLLGASVGMALRASTFFSMTCPP